MYASDWLKGAIMLETLHSLAPDGPSAAGHGILANRMCAPPAPPRGGALSA
ncbi:hypothetical protein [Streptomyces durhamensis]|uniref:hypothetical protein n=1 Tax=Streptomyces durhamensis TaxID=68194 RepID=UPI000AD0DBD9|nr:hypothetical protein [Streptomyces durhamensis]